MRTTLRINYTSARRARFSVDYAYQKRLDLRITEFSFSSLYSAICTDISSSFFFYFSHRSFITEDHPRLWEYLRSLKMHARVSHDRKFKSHSLKHFHENWPTIAICEFSIRYSSTYPARTENSTTARVEFGRDEKPSRLFEYRNRRHERYRCRSETIAECLDYETDKKSFSGS